MRSGPDSSVRTALALLTLAYILSYVDRTIILLLVGPIRTTLGISDTQFSLIQGLAFAILYTLLGLPIGLWADHGNRRLITGLGVLVWSVMTALCGFARTFLQLFAARVGVGIGEAALSPAAYSLITDLAREDALGRALAVYGSAVYVGIGSSFLAGGWLVEHLMRNGNIEVALIGVLLPWQQVLLLVGLPGLVLSVAILLNLPEPRERTVERAPAKGCVSVTLSEHLQRNRRFLAFHFLGFSMVSLLFNGYVAWLAEYFSRTHGWTKSQAGVSLGAVVLIFGTAGMLCGGLVTDLFARRFPKTAALRAAFLGAIALVPWPMWATLVGSPWVSLAGVAPIIFFCTFCFGPAVIALQILTPPRLRAQVAALYLFVVNLAGIGLGGTAIALMSDKVFRDERRIGAAMAVVGTIAVILALGFLWAAARVVRNRDGRSAAVALPDALYEDT